MGTGRPAGQHLTGAGALMSRSCEVGTSYREHQESEVLSGKEQGKITGGSRVVRMAELWTEHVQTPLPRPQGRCGPRAHLQGLRPPPCWASWLPWVPVSMRCTRQETPTVGGTAGQSRSHANQGRSSLADFFEWNIHVHTRDHRCGS